MRNTRASGKSHLFFIEFLIVLFFFLIISSVCLRIFAAARRVTSRADALAHAQTEAASLCEAVRAGEELQRLFPYAAYEDPGTTDSSGTVISRFSVCYDDSFTACPREASAAYTLTAQILTEAHMTTISVVVTDSGNETLYELSAGFYIPLTKGEISS